MSNFLLSVGAIIVFAMLIIYMVIGSVLEKAKPPCGHEAGIIILIGIVVSYLASHVGEGEHHHNLGKMLTFD
jgi:hypothetical protein